MSQPRDATRARETRLQGSATMTTMLAAYLPGDDRVDLREVPVPEPGIGQVRLRMKASGLCAAISTTSTTSMSASAARATWASSPATSPPARSRPSAPAAGISSGRPGRGLPYFGCGFCRSCRKGYQISCTDPARAAYGWQRDGGHAEYLIADEKTWCGYRLPSPTRMVASSPAASAPPTRASCAARCRAATP